ncbi:DUF501 domain-containing protein [Agrococcus sp. Marseille-P2731]|uniref:DUF501 domain-containing protein n=1 Tax=Agrococcus sp. Marseille-P2731 TaxID=1841862 RepID=UPI000931435D|nr:DUF501 domain-containing protein [Agrococcus sp. Marseille-P2731]
MALQLGRTMRGVLGVGARCACGAPTVVVTSPRLPDGTPFPTFYYLTHPAAAASASRLEADGTMAQLQAQLDDPAVADAYAAAHASYLAAREAHGHVEEIAGISAGGMPTRVKCLHAVLAHALVAGHGVNPMGDRTLELGDWSPAVCACAPEARGQRADTHGE